MKKIFLLLMFALCTLLSTTAQTSCNYTYSVISSSGGFSGEGASNLFDGDTDTKWCCSYGSGINVQFDLNQPMRVMGYSITTANDNFKETGRNPKKWLLLASNNKTSWDTIHVVTNDDVLQDVNYTEYVLGLPHATDSSYQYFKYVILANHGAAVIQISEFRLIPTCQYDSVLTHVDGEDATCTTTGVAEYWSNAATGLIFKNAQATEAFYSIKSANYTLPVSLIFPDTTDYSVRIYSNNRGKYLTSADSVYLDESLYITYKVKDPTLQLNRYSIGFNLSASDIKDCSYTVPAAQVLLADPFDIKCAPLEDGSVEITWTGAWPNYEVIVSPSVISDFAYAKGIKNVSGNTYTTALLTPDNLYYIYVRGVDAAADMYSPWIAMPMIAGKLSDIACPVTFYLYDSYGDGWNDNALNVYMDDSLSATLTVPSGSYAEQTLVCSGEIKLEWIKGRYPDEASFYIELPDGSYKSFSNMYYVKNNEIIYQGHLCANVAAPDTILYTYNATLDSVILTWDNTGADSYELAFVTGVQSVASAASVINVTDTRYAIAAVPGQALTVGVRAVEGSTKSEWVTTLVLPQPLPVMSATNYMNSIKAIARDIQLNYYDSSAKMANAPYVTDSAKTGALYMDVLHLALTDSTTLYSDPYWTTGSSLGMQSITYLAFDTTGAMLSDVMELLKEEYTVKVPAGDYYFCFGASSPQSEYYCVIADSAKRNQATPLEFANCYTSTLSGSETYYSPSVGGRPQKLYTFSLTDTTEIKYYFSYSGYNGYMVLTTEKDSIIEGTNYANNGYQTLLPGNYRIYVTGADGDMTRLTVWKETAKANVYTEIPSDTVFYYTPETKVGMINLRGYEVPGFAYKFTVSDTTNIMLTGISGSTYYNFYVFTDSLMNNLLFSEDMGGYLDYDYYSNFCTSKDSTLYLLITFEYGLPQDTIFQTLHLQTDWSNPALYTDTIAVGTPVQVEIGMQAPTYDYDWYDDPTPVVAKMVYMEKGKYYRFAYTADTIYDVLDDGVLVLVGLVDTLTSYIPYQSRYSYEYNYNFCYGFFYADSTGYYPVYLTAYYYDFVLNPYQTTLLIHEVQPLDTLVAQAPLVTPAYKAEGTMTGVTPTGYEYDFQYELHYHDAENEYAAYSAVAAKVMLGAGDSLFVDGLASEDISLYLFKLYSDGTVNTRLAYADESDLAQAGEQMTYVSNYSDSIMVAVVLAYDTLNVIDGTYSLRIAKSNTDMQNTVVTATVDKESIEVIGLDSKASDVREELAKLVLTAVDASGLKVADLDNDPSVWEINMSEGVATYEFNNGDLPLGYEFASFTEYVQVSFILKNGLEEVSADDTTDAPRATKFFYNGQIYIRTVDGAIYTVTGLRVK